KRGADAVAGQTLQNPPRGCVEALAAVGLVLRGDRQPEGGLDAVVLLDVEAEDDPGFFGRAGRGRGAGRGQDGWGAGHGRGSHHKGFLTASLRFATRRRGVVVPPSER